MCRTSHHWEAERHIVHLLTKRDLRASNWSTKGCWKSRWLHLYQSTPSDDCNTDVVCLGLVQGGCPAILWEHADTRRYVRVHHTHTKHTHTHTQTHTHTHAHTHAYTLRDQALEKGMPFDMCKANPDGTISATEVCVCLLATQAVCLCVFMCSCAFVCLCL